MMMLLLLLFKFIFITNFLFNNFSYAFEQQQHEIGGEQQQQPTFDKTIENVIVKVGQQAILPCFINNLGSYRVIWTKSGDILTLGTTKINTDNRLSIQHRYVSEWHLMIDNVATDDEGEYICKTNGNFFKIVNLQVLIPPSIDDLNSTPAGTITLKEGSSVTLKCFADGKPAPMIKWYRWKKYKKFISEKEELNDVSNEIHISAIKRNDANIYECVAKNSVPPATSRIFNIEIQFVPTVELNVRKTFQYLHKQISLECKISANPVERVYWSRNGIVINQNDHLNYNSNDYNQNIIEKFDNSNIDDFYKMILTLTIMSLKKHDFGEYQCCAENLLGTTCSNVFLQEIKINTIPLETTPKTHKTTTTTLSILDTITSTFNDDESLSNIVYNDYDSTNTENGNINEENVIKVNESNNNNNIIDWKDKRRHFLSNTKDYLRLQSQVTSKATSFKCVVILTLILPIIISRFF